MKTAIDFELYQMTQFLISRYEDFKCSKVHVNDWAPNNFKITFCINYFNICLTNLKINNFI